MEQVVKNALVKLSRRCGQFLLTVQFEIGFPQLFISLYWNRDLERGLLECFLVMGLGGGVADEGGGALVEYVEDSSGLDGFSFSDGTFVGGQVNHRYFADE